MILHDGEKKPQDIKRNERLQRPETKPYLLYIVHCAETKVTEFDQITRGC